MEDSTLLGAIIGAGGTVLGGGLVAWGNAAARRRQWEREQAEKDRQAAADAAAQAELTLERANPEALTLWGTNNDVQAKIADLQAHMRTAHASLTNVRVTHRVPEVRQAAADARSALVAAVNDVALFAATVRLEEGASLSLDEAREAREQARDALERYEESLHRAGNAAS